MSGGCSGAAGGVEGWEGAAGCGEATLVVIWLFFRALAAFEALRVSHSSAPQIVGSSEGTG